MKKGLFVVIVFISVICFEGCQNSQLRNAIDLLKVDYNMNVGEFYKKYKDSLSLMLCKAKEYKVISVNDDPVKVLFDHYYPFYDNTKSTTDIYAKFGKTYFPYIDFLTNPLDNKLVAISAAKDKIAPVDVDKLIAEISREFGKPNIAQKISDDHNRTYSWSDKTQNIDLVVISYKPYPYMMDDMNNVVDVEDQPSTDSLESDSDKTANKTSDELLHYFNCRLFVSLKKYEKKIFHSLNFGVEKFWPSNARWDTGFDGFKAIYNRYSGKFRVTSYTDLGNMIDSVENYSEYQAPTFKNDMVNKYHSFNADLDHWLLEEKPNIEVDGRKLSNDDYNYYDDHPVAVRFILGIDGKPKDIVLIGHPEGKYEDLDFHQKGALNLISRLPPCNPAEFNHVPIPLKVSTFVR